MISNTALAKRINKKMDTYVVDTLFAAKRSKAWNKIAQIISGGRRKYPSINLSRIDKESSGSEILVIPGKVLGSGDLSKKVKICALYFSESAMAKIKEKKAEAIKIIDEIKKNPNAEGIKILI